MDMQPIFATQPRIVRSTDNPAYGAIVVYDSTGATEVKLPAAAGATGIAGVVVLEQETFGDSVISEEFSLAKNGDRVAVNVTGPVAPGDEIQIADTSGNGKTANPAPGEKVGVLGTAISAATSEQDRVMVEIGIYEKVGEPYTSTSAPTSDNDSADTAGDGRYFQAGSVWVRTGTTKTIYVCLDATAEAAVWEELADPTITPGEAYVTTTDPTTDNDSADTAGSGRAFEAGAFWANTSDDSLFVCLDATAEAAVWVEIVDNSIVRAGETYTSADADPTSDNDGADTAALGKEFAVGAFWTNATDDSLWVCLDASTGAAVWLEVVDNSVVRAGEMHVSTADPAANNDGVDTATLGKEFAVGALWLNTTDGGLFWCDDNSTGAAVWNEATAA